MARIKLIVTGDAEKLALHKSLQGLFPRQRNGEDVVWDDPRKLQCATSYRLPELPAPNAPSPRMLNLAQAMLDEAGIGKRGTPADLVIVIDDVELGNCGREHHVADHFRAAVVQKIASQDARTQERYRGLLRAKCSFHLLKPMVESYFFGDTQALQVAGVPSGEIPCLVGADVEAFETNDPAWLPTCQSENPKRRFKFPEWRHECHPKHYLEHLLQRGSTLYEETKHGANALAAMRWGVVPKAPSHASVIRALIEDISDWFGISSPLGIGDLHPAFFPGRAVNRDLLVLRNL